MSFLMAESCPMLTGFVPRQNLPSKNEDDSQLYPGQISIELFSLGMRKLLPSTVSCQATRSRGRESLCPGGQPQMSIVRLNDTPIQSQKMDSFCGRINISYNM